MEVVSTAKEQYVENSALTHSELISQLNQKNEQILSLLKLFLDNCNDFSLNSAEINEALATIQRSVAKIELEQTRITLDYEKAAQQYNATTTRLDADHKKALDQYETINTDRLLVIAKLKNQITSYKYFSLGGMIKTFLRPRIGSLYHHVPKRLKTPKRYNKKINLDNPLSISIVTPSYNQADYIEKTINSVLDQNYPALEYVIQDGGSTDDSAECIRKYETSLKHWESKKDKGQADAINLGFQHTSGDIMAYLNSDDLLMPGTLHYVADFFAKNPDVDAVYGHRILIDEYDQDVGRWVLPHHDSKALTWADFVPQETLFWRRSIWEKVGGIDDSFRFALDWDLLLRFQEAGAKLKRLPRFLGAFRIHPEQKTSSAMTDIGAKEMDRLRLRCHKRRVSPQEINYHLRFYKIKHIICHRLYSLGILRY